MMCSMSTISCKTAYCSFTYFSPAPWGNQASLPKFFQNPSISNADYDRLQVLLLFLRKLQSISHASEAPHSFFLLLSRALYSTVFVLIEGFLTDKLIDCFRGCVAQSCTELDAKRDSIHDRGIVFSANRKENSVLYKKPLSIRIFSAD